MPMVIIVLVNVIKVSGQAKFKLFKPNTDKPIQNNTTGIMIHSKRLVAIPDQSMCGQTQLYETEHLSNLQAMRKIKSYSQP